MDLAITSLQDTVKNKNLIRLVPEEINSGDLNIQQTLLPVLEITERDLAVRQIDTVVKTQKSTAAQIRYWQWQREIKLLVGGSRYMEPKNNVQLTSLVVHENKTIELPVREKFSNSTDWLTIILFFALLLFATVRNSFSIYLNHLMQSVINYSTASRMFQEKNNSLFNASIRLEVFFYFAISVFLYQLVIHFRIDLPYRNFYLYLFCLGFVFAYYFLKNIVYRFVGSVVEGTQETSEYLFNLSNFNRIAGLFIFPIVTLIAFNPFESADFVIVAGVVVLIGFYILLIRRGIGILLKKQFSIFYLFLYLCSLEFLPLLLIYKVVVV